VARPAEEAATPAPSLEGRSGDGLAARSRAAGTASRRARLLPAERRLLLVGIDVLIVAVAAALAAAMAEVFDPVPGGGEALSWNLLLGAVILLLGSVAGIHDFDVALRPRRAVPALITAAAGGLFALMVTFFVLGRPIFALRDEGLDLTRGALRPPPRLAPLLFIALSLLALGAWRFAAAKLLSSRLLRHRALVVGAGASARRLLADLSGGIPHHYELLGLVDDDPEKAGLRLGSLRVLTDRQGLVETARRLDVHELILATTRQLHPDLLRELIRCYELGMVIRPMPAVYEELAGRVPVEHLGQKWFLAPFWNEIGLPGIEAAAKRTIDLAVAVVGLALTAVLFVPIALAIKLDSRGPVVYRQERLGRGGRPFQVVKLRTMTLDAEPSGEPVWAARRDPRVTRVGRVLRRTRLDELPQFWNVLKGEMSVVGPRPERAAFIQRLEHDIPFYRIRLAVKPGLTGWAQIRYPYANSYEDALRKLEYDLYYVKNQSLLLDLVIIARTIGVVLAFRGH